MDSRRAKADIGDLRALLNTQVSRPSSVIGQHSLPGDPDGVMIGAHPSSLYFVFALSYAAIVIVTASLHAPGCIDGCRRAYVTSVPVRTAKAASAGTA